MQYFILFYIVYLKPIIVCADQLGNNIQLILIVTETLASDAQMANGRPDRFEYYSKLCKNNLRHPKK